jgi:polar amino acid transport system substrate-binding protein
MIRLISLLACVLIGFSQQTLTVYVNKLEGKVEALEKEIVQGVVDIYNKKNKEKLVLKFVPLASFEQGFEKVASEENCIVINSVTITEERKKLYDFSVPYLPVKNAILIRSNSNIKDPKAWQKKGAKISFTRSTTGEAILLEETKKYALTLIPFDNRTQRIDALKKKVTNFAIGDNILSWDDPEIAVLYEFDDSGINNFGILFPKGSKLKASFDKTLTYYLRSPKFHQTTTQIFGNEITNYFKRYMK